MLELYHNTMSSCAQKVRVALAEKGLDWKSHHLNLRAGDQQTPAYLELNPKGVVPTLIDSDLVIRESNVILEYLDDAFPEPPMRPADPAGRHALRLWSRRFDASIQASISVVTFAIGPRRLLLEQPAEIREANIEAIPDPENRARRRSVVEHGIKAPEFAGSLARLVALLDDMEVALSAQPWLSGEGFGLADAGVLPYVLRLDHLAMTPLLSADARPRLADWYARIQARPAFAVAVTEWLPAPILAIFRAGGEAVWADVEPMTRAAD